MNLKKDRFIMLIGIPKEIKNHEYRVGLIPSSIQELISQGHQVIVEKNSGVGIGIEDKHYLAVGAQIVERAADIFARAEIWTLD